MTTIAYKARLLLVATAVGPFAVWRAALAAAVEAAHVAEKRAAASEVPHRSDSAHWRLEAGHAGHGGAAEEQGSSRQHSRDLLLLVLQAASGSGPQLLLQGQLLLLLLSGGGGTAPVFSLSVGCSAMTLARGALTFAKHRQRISETLQPSAAALEAASSAD